MGSPGRGARTSCELLLEIARHHGFEIEELKVYTDHGHLLFIEFSAEVFNRAGGGGVQGGECARDSRGIPGVRKQLWGGKFWGTGILRVRWGVR
jgi:putative transposase